MRIFRRVDSSSSHLGGDFNREVVCKRDDVNRDLDREDIIRTSLSSVGDLDFVRLRKENLDRIL